MRIFKLIKSIVVYYLLFCGLSVNALFSGIYFYDKSIIYAVNEKVEKKIKLAINPNALIDEQNQLRRQLDNEISTNFGQWQPLPEKDPVEPGTVKIGGSVFKTIREASASLQDDQEMQIGQGTYLEPLVIKKNNVKIIGSGRAVFDGINAEGKGAIITKGNNITIANIECKNISVSDHNGACIRSEGANLIVDHVYFHDSEQGILSSSNEYLHITDSRFEKLGKNGFAHGIYIDSGELIIENSLFIAAVSEGHEIKSRARKTVIKNSIIASLSSNDSRLIDIPNGGELIISDSVLEKGPQSVNSTAIGYGLEGIKYNQNEIIIKKSVIILERSRFNKLLDINKNIQPLITAANNLIVSKQELDIGGVNWIYSSREEAKINAYPYIPILENYQKTVK